MIGEEAAGARGDAQAARTRRGAPRGGRAFRVLWANAALRRVVLASGVMNLAEWAYVTALSIDALRLGGAFGVALVGLRFFAGAFATMLSGGFAERERPGRLLVIVPLIRVALVGATAYVAHVSGGLGPILALLGVVALVGGPYRAATSTVIPVVARSPAELAASAAALTTVKALGQAIGAVLGASLLTVVSPSTVYAGAAVGFFCAAAMAGSAADLRLGAAETSAPTHSLVALVRSTAAAVEHVHVETILALSGLRALVRGTWTATAVLVSIRLLNAGNAGVGLLLLAGGAGGLCAAPLAARLVLRERIGTPVAFALGGCGLPLLLVAAFPRLGVAVGLMAGWGAAMALADAGMASLLNRLVPGALASRATSAVEGAKQILEGTGAFVGPALAVAISIRGALVMAALLMLIFVTTRWALLHSADASAGDRERLLELAHDVPCLTPLDMADLDALIGRLAPVEVSEVGAEVVRQGEPGDRFYIVQDGEFEVLVDNYRVAVLEAGEAFGERALLRDVPRTATVCARQPGHLLALARRDFLEAVTGSDEVRAATPNAAPSAPATSDASALAKVLGRVGLFSHLGSDELTALASAARVQHFPLGSFIIRQGERGDRYFIVLAGRAVVRVDGREIGDLRAGDPFGEIALLHDVERSADVVASSEVVVASLGRDDVLPTMRARVLSG